MAGRRGVPALLALAALAALAPTAHAWTFPAPIATVPGTDTATDPVLRLDHDGNAVVVWLQSPHPDSPSHSNTDYQVRGATIPAGTAAVTELPPLSDPGANQNLASSLPSLRNLTVDVA